VPKKVEQINDHLLCYATIVLHLNYQLISDVSRGRSLASRKPAVLSQKSLHHSNASCVTGGAKYSVTRRLHCEPASCPSCGSPL